VSHGLSQLLSAYGWREARRDQDRSADEHERGVVGRRDAKPERARDPLNVGGPWTTERLQHFERGELQALAGGVVW
jgi:hypothetical protein